MSATNTNKQPVFIDRPLIARSRLTNQIVGTSTDLSVQGGQSPALLVDMDASLSSDNNSGGIVDSIRITRDNTSVAINPDYTVNAVSSGNYIGVVSGQTVYIENSGVLSSAVNVGYYTFTGTTATGNYNVDIDYNTNFVYTAVESGVLPAVTFAVYHTRGTTVPIPADGDYHLVFTKTMGVNVTAVDCTNEMPELSAPVMSAGNINGIEEGAPLKNRAINLQRGDRIYIGVVQKGVYNTSSGLIPGAHVIAQGGYY